MYIFVPIIVALPEIPWKKWRKCQPFQCMNIREKSFDDVY